MPLRPVNRPRRRPNRWLAATLCCAGLPCLAAEPPVDAGWLLARLERPVPSTTPFVELRGSALLDAPLRVSGEYRRPAEDVLVRVVHAPHPESTTLRDGTIELERNGKVRLLALSRAAELAGLRAGFGALLGGDRATLERHFDVDAAGH